MYFLRKWSVRNARLLEITYELVERALLVSAPLLGKLGHSKMEKPVAAEILARKLRSVLDGVPENTP